MPEIEITEEQRERLDGVRGALKSEVVGPYGTVEPRDAVEYLLDLFDGQEGVPLPEGYDPSAAGASGDSANEADESDAENGDDESDTDDDAESKSESASDSSGAAQLNSMMNLLEEHDDKWREASSGDEKYEVDLPDGGTERARTKDDIKAILFKNYR